MIRAKLPCVKSASLRDTGDIGTALAKNVYPGLLVFLRGDLGAGKTQLVRAVGHVLGVDNVKSPTFAIESIHHIPGEAFSFVHADLYRLEAAKIAVIQLEEYLDDGHIVFVEWAEKWEKPPLENRWDVSILLTKDDNRFFGFSAFGDRSITAMSEAYMEILDIKGGNTHCR